jgi:hypothetical protein
VCTATPQIKKFTKQHGATETIKWEHYENVITVIKRKIKG